MARTLEGARKLRAEQREQESAPRPQGRSSGSTTSGRFTGLSASLDLIPPEAAQSVPEPVQQARAAVLEAHAAWKAARAEAFALRNVPKRTQTRDQLAQSEAEHQAARQRQEDLRADFDAAQRTLAQTMLDCREDWLASQQQGIDVIQAQVAEAIELLLGAFSALRVEEIVRRELQELPEHGSLAGINMGYSYIEATPQRFALAREAQEQQLALRGNSAAVPRDEYMLLAALALLSGGVTLAPTQSEGEEQEPLAS